MLEILQSIPARQAADGFFFFFFLEFHLEHEKPYWLEAGEDRPPVLQQTFS